MNNTLYVKDEDSPIWDKARELTADQLSHFEPRYIVAGARLSEPETPRDRGSSSHSQERGS